MNPLKIDRSPMYKTPNFFTLIEFIAIALDIFEKNSRKRIFSESKSYTRKQLAFKTFTSEVEKKILLSEEQRKNLFCSLMKVENILSDLKSTPIYSDIAPHNAEKIFVNLFTIPFIRQLCSTISTIDNNIFFCVLSELLNSPFTTQNIIKNFKTILIQKIEKFDIHESTLRDIKIKLSKLSSKAFNTVKNIEKESSEIYCKDFSDKSTLLKLQNTVRITWLAGRFAFLLAKKIENMQTELACNEKTIIDSFKNLGEEYIFNSKIEDTNDCYIHNSNFILCKKFFLKQIRQEDPAIFLKMHGTTKLWFYKEGLFLSYCLWHQLLSDLAKNRFTEERHKIYLGQIKKLKTRQPGNDAVNIAIILIGMTVITSHTIPTNSLTPLVNLFIEHLPKGKGDILTFLTQTPFGDFIPDQQYSNESNLTFAIKSFNDGVKSGTISAPFCNPLSPLNNILETYFSNGKLSKRDLNRRSIKTEKCSIYDALRSIDHLILSFGLEDTTEFTDATFCKVTKSHCGENINQYLTLPYPKRKKILEDIDAIRVSKESYPFIAIGTFQ